MITFENLGGVGTNVRVLVRQDSKQVAVIVRNGNRGRSVESIPYYRTLKQTRDLDSARAWALTATFPTPVEIYNTICAEVLERRRRQGEQYAHEDFVRLAREIANSDNPVSNGIVSLLVEIEVWARDRLNPHWRGAQYSGNEAKYPDPPVEK